MRIVWELFGDLVPDPDEQEIERLAQRAVGMIGAEPSQRLHRVVVWLPPLPDPAPSPGPGGQPDPGPASSPQPVPATVAVPPARPVPALVVPRQFRSPHPTVAQPSVPGGTMTDHPTPEPCCGESPGSDPCVPRPAWAGQAHIRPDGAEFSRSVTFPLPGEGNAPRTATLQVRQRVRLALDGDGCVRIVHDVPVLHLSEISCTQEQVTALVDAILLTTSSVPFPPPAVRDAEGGE